MSDIPQKEKKQQRSVQNCTVLHALATCSYFSVCSEFFYLTCSGTGALGLTMWAPQPSCTLLPSRQLAGGFPLNRCSAQPLLRSASLRHPSSAQLRYTTCSNTTGVLSPHCIILYLPYLYCIHHTCTVLTVGVLSPLHFTLYWGYYLYYNLLQESFLPVTAGYLSSRYAKNCILYWVYYLYCNSYRSPFSLSHPGILAPGRLESINQYTIPLSTRPVLARFTSTLPFYSNRPTRSQAAILFMQNLL